MKLDILDLRLLIAIAECGNLTKGAHQIFLAPSSASHRLKLMEENIGTRIFNREARGVSLTSAGEIVFLHAKKVLANLEQMQLDIFPYTQNVQTHLKLWANTNAIHTYLPDDLAMFLEKFPNVKLLLEEHSSHKIAEAVFKGEIEVGIVAEQDLGTEVKLLPYKSDRLVLIVPVNHELAEHERVKFDHLVEFPFVLLDEGSAIHKFIINKAALLSKHLNLRAQVKSFDAVCRMVSANVGISLLPYNSVILHNKQNLHVIELDETWAKRDLMICLCKHSSVSGLSKILIDFLLKGQPKTY